METPSTVKKALRELPNKPGVYLMKNRIGNILYIGKAKNLKKRASSYFQKKLNPLNHQPKIRSMVELVHHIDFFETANESEALILESKLIKKWKPKYNTILKDDKRFLLLKVNLQAEIPSFKLVRFYKKDNAQYFGPFTSSAYLKKTLTELRKEFGIILDDTQPKEINNNTYQLYDDVRSEIYGEHPNIVTIQEYHARVEKACGFLKGKSKKWLNEIQVKMNNASEKMQYEKAAGYKNILTALIKTTEHNRKFIKDPEVSGSPQQIKPVLQSLQKLLNLPTFPGSIECFDISHISGTFTVASMVSFLNGTPNKGQYRRYKIKSHDTNDDFRSMEEVVYRRYDRLIQQKTKFPDLIIIDGGKGQIKSAQKSFLLLDKEHPPIIGLAKKHEHIILPNKQGTLKLSLDDPIVKLLQRIRDEAHRFANSFNEELRRKKIKESILDDFKGIGPEKRLALLQKFQSIPKLKQATIKEVTSISGIGPKTAQRLQEFLNTFS